MSILVVLLILFTLIFVYGIMYAIPHYDHKYASVRYTNQWDYGTFEDFKREFYKRKWEMLDGTNRIQDSNTASLISFTTIQFNNKGMVLSGLDFIRVQRFIKKYLKTKKDKQVKGLWGKKHLKVVK